MANTFVVPFTGHEALTFNDIADNLQGNILKSHGRGFANHIFITFKNDPATRTAVKKLIKKMANDGEITSTKKQFSDAEEFKKNKTQFLFTGIYISKIGYDYLLNGDAPRLANIPADASFRRGMKAPATLATLSDPALAQWESGLNKDFHVMFLLAHAKKESLAIFTDELKIKLAPFVQDEFIQEGNGIKNNADDHIEHFGYVDGISQPVFFKDDLEDVLGKTKTDKWNPSTSLDRLIVPDPLGKAGTNSFGSYFVFRKLEQNVRDFKLREQSLAVELGLANRELAGAMVVGRFENGMPVTMSNEDVEIAGEFIAANQTGKINNFNYNGDAQGAKCPFHGHIRKSNPRGSGGFETPDIERKHLFARRGITYGARKMEDNNPEVLAEAEFENMPTGGVGLLFMCLNVEIANQFEFMQGTWVNNNNFPAGGPHGIDPVIGQNAIAGNQKYASDWNKPTSIKPSNGFKDFVTMKGGEYFFTPSISFLQSL